MKKFSLLFVLLVSCGDSKNNGQVPNEVINEVVSAPVVDSFENAPAVVPNSCFERMPGEKVEVILIAGQSNAAFFADSHTVSAYPEKVLMTTDGLSCLPSSDVRPWADGSSGKGGSVWNLFADRLIAEGKADRVVFVNIAKGGSSIKEWRNQFLTLFVEKAKELRTNGLNPTAILWAQGESNNELGPKPMTSDEYFQALTEIVGAFRGNEINAPFYAALSTVCGNAPSVEVRSAIQRASEVDGLNVLVGPDTDTIGSDSRDSGNCHYNLKGQEQASSLWFESFK